MAEEWRIVEVGVDEVDRVGDLWKELRAHHDEVTEQAWPTHVPEESWARRREIYVGWLAGGEGSLFVVLGEDDEAAPIGYAMLRIGASGPTWDLGGAVGDLETLSVTAAARGRGIGRALMDRCRERLRERGANWWTVTVVAANAGAVDLYAREGFADYWRTMIAPVE